MAPMDRKLAVLFMPDDMTLTTEKTPLMLRPILFCPILTWMAEELMGQGIERFFIVSDVRAHDMMRPYLPEAADVTYVDGAKHGEALLKLLANEKGDVLIVNGAVLPVGVFSGGAVYSASAKECCKVLREHGAFAAFPKGAEITQGFLPVGDDDELRDAQDMCRRKIAEKHLKAGVSILDANSVYIDPRVKIGSGTVLLPGTILRGRTVIGENCTIGPNAMIRDCTIGDGTEVNASQLNESTVGAHTAVGPFAYVRPGSRIGSHVRCGDFVEVKNSTIGDGTKISHLTYIGDSDVGKNINFGCGTVTVNYDRVKKSRTVIDDDAFIGCNANLIAPVHIGEGAYIAAGSTVTDDVPPAALAIARARQQNKRDWANRHKLKEKK